MRVPELAAGDTFRALCPPSHTGAVERTCVSDSSLSTRLAALSLYNATCREKTCPETFVKAGNADIRLPATPQGSIATVQCPPSLFLGSVFAKCLQDSDQWGPLIGECKGV